MDLVFFGFSKSVSQFVTTCHKLTGLEIVLCDVVRQLGDGHFVRTFWELTGTWSHLFCQKQRWSYVEYKEYCQS